MKKDLSFDEFSSPTEKDWQNKLSQELQNSLGSDKLLNFTTTSELVFAPLYSKTDRSSELPGFVPYRRGFKARADFLKLKYNLNTPFQHDELYPIMGYFPNILEFDARVVSVNQIESACRNLASFLNASHAHECEYRLRVSELSLPVALLDSLSCPDHVAVVLDLSQIFFNRTENTLDLKYNLDLFVWATRHSKRKIKLLFSGAVYDELGASSTLQNALVLTFFCEVFELLTERGLSQSNIFALTEFELSLSEKTFESVAQIRSFREMLYNVFVAKQIACEDFCFPIHATCSKKSFTALDFWQNILRCSSVIMSACFSNVSSVTPVSLLARLKELSLTTEHLPSNADAIAMNSYHMLIRESHLAQVADPLGGSYMQEDLTNQLNEKTFELLQQISHAKSFHDFLKSSLFTELINKTIQEELKIIHRRKKIVAGINEYPAPIDLYSNANESSQYEQSFSNGDSDASKLFVIKLRQVWHENKGSFEKSDWFDLVSMFSDGMCLRQVQNILNSHAEFQFFVNLTPIRLTGALEELRIKFNDEQLQLKHVIILVSGDQSVLQNRINFIKNLLQLFAIPVQVETSLDKIVDGDEQLVILCTSDGQYLELIQAAIQRIKKSMQFVAGAPEISDDQLLKYRLERIKVGMDVFDFGQKLIKRFKLKGRE